MSYGKKDEDAEQAIVKVDRTSVFQEGWKGYYHSWQWQLLTHEFSTVIQYLPNFSSKMPDPSHKNCSTSLYRREIPYQRSDFTFLRHFKALPEQGCLAQTDGLPCHQGTGDHRRGCDNGDQQYYERYIRRKRCSIQSECDTGSLQDH